MSKVDLKSSGLLGEQNALVFVVRKVGSLGASKRSLVNLLFRSVMYFRSSFLSPQ